MYYFVYILYNIKTRKYYIGRTINVNKRYKEHKAGLNKSTKYKCFAWKFIYAEIYLSERDAINRERRLKSHGSGLVEIKKRTINSISLINFKTGEGLML